MIRFLLPITVLLGGHFAIFAVPPEIPSAPVLVAVGGRPAVVTVTVKPGTKFVAAPAFSPEDVLWFPGETDPSGRKVYLVQPYRPGVYRVVFFTVGDETYSTLVIDASGAGPVPPPPRPTPGPVTETKLFVVVVEETEQAAAGRGAFFTDSALSARFREKGHRWRVVDKDVRDGAGAVPADIKPYLEAAGSYPTLFLVEQVTGRVRYKGAVPATPAGLLDAIKKAGG